MGAAENMPLLLTLAQACEITGLCDDTLRAEMKEGLLPFVRIRRTRYLTRDDLDQWIKAKREAWQSEQTLSASARTRRSGTKTSRSTVIGFEEARKRRTKRKLD